MRKTEYLTLEALESAEEGVTECIKCINHLGGDILAYTMIQAISKYLIEYKKLIQKDIEEVKK